MPLRWVHCVQAWGPWCQASWRAGLGGLHGACPRSRPASGLCVLPSGSHWAVTRGDPPHGGAPGAFSSRPGPTLGPRGPCTLGQGEGPRLPFFLYHVHYHLGSFLKVLNVFLLLPFFSSPKMFAYILCSPPPCRAPSGGLGEAQSQPRVAWPWSWVMSPHPQVLGHGQPTPPFHAPRCQVEMAHVGLAQWGKPRNEPRCWPLVALGA